MFRKLAFCSIVLNFLLISIPSFAQIKTNNPLGVRINLYGGISIPTGRLSNETTPGGSFGGGIEKNFTKNFSLELNYLRNTFSGIPTTAASYKGIGVIEKISLLSNYTFYNGFTQISSKTGVGLYFFREGYIIDPENNFGVNLGVQSDTKLNNYIDLITGFDFNSVFRESTNLNYLFAYGGVSLKW